MRMHDIFHNFHLDERPSGDTLLLALLTLVVVISYALLAAIIVEGPAAYDLLVNAVASMFRTVFPVGGMI